jgi:hypothetical protein
MFSIETGEIIQGDIPKSQMRIVQAWTELHRDELKRNFELLTSENASYFKIEPLH